MDDREKSFKCLSWPEIAETRENISSVYATIPAKSLVFRSAKSLVFRPAKSLVFHREIPVFYLKMLFLVL